MLRRAAVLALPAILLLFAWAGDGLFAGFSGDDLMNLHGHWMTPWPDLLVQLFVPSADAYRPLGGVVYRIFHWIFGLDPAPWRAFCFTVLAFDLVLTAGLVARLTRSPAAGAVAAVLLSYHARMADLYYNGGTVYELLCFGGVLGAFWLYAEIDVEGHRVSPLRVAAITAACLAAWGAKEMAAALPALLLAWEACPPGGMGRIRRFVSGASTRSISFWATVLISASFSWVKVSVQSPLQKVELYQPSFTPAAWGRSTAHYLDQIFYRADYFGPWSAAATLVAVITMGLLLRRRETSMAAAWIVLSALPIAFIEPRSGFAYFIPLFGWALWLTSILASVPGPRFHPLFAAGLAALVLIPCTGRKQRVPGGQ